MKTFFSESEGSKLSSGLGLPCAQSGSDGFELGWVHVRLAINRRTTIDHNGGTFELKR